MVHCGDGQADVVRLWLWLWFGLWHYRSLGLGWWVHRWLGGNLVLVLKVATGRVSCRRF
jgi:hypothetical protein